MLRTTYRISPAQCMSNDSYHQPPFSIPIPQSSDIRTYHFNWCLTCRLVNPFHHTNIHHIRKYHPLLCTVSSPFYTVQCAGSHRFEFLNPDHSYLFLVVQFTILPSILSYLPLTYTSPCTINSCPVIYSGIMLAVIVRGGERMDGTRCCRSCV